ncbi:MAG: hypothetical protein HON53_05840 [Planctomycetaceae bacterium]|jgi:hypothetical protein|nr:hypothetical protein [Planctomycetaceae bacterium]MBT6154441.1 hypothetical protein [Planctomycetaceae bacterium]MBT6487252.1 hypothetical protein [Planctomycetaceae bacterium]MBT6498252.1 hypothetical protein [Planctomycetaceae bacterium]
MKKCFAALLVVVTVGVFANEVSAWLIPFSKARIAAAGKHCVHGYDGNFGAVGTYYAGDTAAINEQLANFGKPKIPSILNTPFVSKTVVLHVGPMVVPKYVAQNRKIPTDWLVQTFRRSDSDSGKFGGLRLHIDIWLGGRVKLNELRIPADFTVKSGGEIEDFIERQPKNKK